MFSTNAKFPTNKLIVKPIPVKIPKGTLEAKDDNESPSNDTPAFANANNGIIPNAT